MSNDWCMCAIGKATVTAPDGLHVRAHADPDAASEGVNPCGTVLDVWMESVNPGWWLVQNEDGLTGWSKAEYLDLRLSASETVSGI